MKLLPLHALLGSIALALPAPALQEATLLMSASATGVPGNMQSDLGYISGNGRWVALQTASSNLVVGDTNGFVDVYLKDTSTGVILLVSVSDNEQLGNANSGLDARMGLSVDGNRVAFASLASNFAALDTNGVADIFVRDISAGSTITVSTSSSGVLADGESVHPQLSRDGRYVGFRSLATNLVPGDVNAQMDVFVKDLQTGQTDLVSVDVFGQQSTALSSYPSLSADGMIVAFSSLAPLDPADTNGFRDIYVRDRLLGTTTWVTRGIGGAVSNGTSAAPFITPDAHYVCFDSSASNLVAVDSNGHEDSFRGDLVNGTFEIASISTTGAQANEIASLSSISDDGQRVSFSSGATNLHPGATIHLDHCYLRDFATGTTLLLDVNTLGVTANSGSNAPRLSGDGRRVVFDSGATNLVPAGTVFGMDVFLRELVGAHPTTYCNSKVNSLGCFPSIGASGWSSASSTSGFVVLGANVRNNKSGLLFYGISGQAALPFQGGTLCVKSPIKRTPGVNSGGAPAPANDCSGVYQLDLNAFAAGALGGTPLPALSQAGTVVDCQWWGRDPGFPAPGNTTLTDALEFVVGA